MEIEKILKKNGYRVTKERVDVFNFIKTKHIFSYNDIQNTFNNIGRSSIFRIINLFLDIGIIRKVNLGDKIETYELNSKDHHHEHMKCEACNCIISFHSDNICKKIFEEATKLGFSVKSHNIGVYGTCKNCL